MHSLRGKLLVATPGLEDPNFRRTVVLIGEHTEDGALGVVLNRPSGTTVAEAVPDLAGLVDEDASVHVGGPVQPSAVLVLAEFVAPGTDRQLVVGDVGFLAIDDDEHEVIATATQRARVFAGYAGWGGGQLEAEIERKDWLIEPCLPGDVFTDEPGTQWARVLERKGGSWRLVARMPLDPRMN